MVIAVDFDGTIVTHEYPKIGKEIPFAIETLLALQNCKEHHQIILWTVREGQLLQEAVDYCHKKGLDFYAINKNHPDDDDTLQPRKIAADIYIDDHNFGGLPDWGTIYQKITQENLKPKKKRFLFF
jgi:hypothetical protein